MGRFADANALAAVGTNGEIVALLVSLSLGLAVGANVLLARLIGGDQQEAIPEAVHGALGIALLLGGTRGNCGAMACPSAADVDSYPSETGTFHVVIRKINCRSRSVLQLLQIGVPAALQGAYSALPISLSRLR